MTSRALASLLLFAAAATASALGASCGSSGTGGTTSTTGQTGGAGGTATGSTATGSSATGGSATTSATGTGTGGAPQAPTCAPLPAPTGNVVNVDPSMVGQLQQIVAQAQAGDTILLADGTYDLAGAYLWIQAPGVTLRSRSGDPTAVVIDGGYATTEIVTVVASDVTVAELTLRRASTHGVHVTTDTADTLRARIYRVHIEDPAEQAIKINPGAAKTGFADDGEVACSRMLLTDAGRPHVNPTSGGCYTGGIDAHMARGWAIRDNHIEGFWCPSGLSEHAVHFWNGGRDNLVERNVLVDNGRGVGFGLTTSGTPRTYPDDPCPAAAGAFVGHYGGVVRNNFIVGKRAELFASGAGFDTGIMFWAACNATAVHNTVMSTGPLFSAIEWRFPVTTGTTITNNLTSHPLLERDGATATQAGNVASAAAAMFVDVAAANLHLAPGATAALDKGVSVPASLCAADIDGDPRSATPDVGADEAKP